LKIHVVKPGESIWYLSKIYGVTPSSIIAANGLQNQASLVIGQAIVIPTNETTYRVKPGESLWSIAARYNVSVNSIMSLNNIQNPMAVYPGTVIKIPGKSKQYGYIEVNAFIQPSTPEKERSLVKETGEYLTYIAPFSYHIQADASLLPLEDNVIISEAYKDKVAPMLSITNLGPSNFETDLINKILSSDTLQQTLINNIKGILKTKGYYGVILDIERIPPEGRTLYNNFLKKVTKELHKDNYVVATALAPKTYDITEGSWHGAHDYKAHGEIVDFVVIMTYEWGWSGGPPMAVAPINEVEKVIKYAVSVIPPSKIMMGIPFYGYDWTLPYVPKGEFAKAVGNEEAVQIALQNGAIIKYDTKSESPYFNYIDKNKLNHVVWFEDARSIQAKFKLASKYNLRGVSYWALGKPFTQNWTVLDDMFNIVKVIK
jgi:spore germination protein